MEVKASGCFEQQDLDALDSVGQALLDQAQGGEEEKQSDSEDEDGSDDEEQMKKLEK